MKIGIDCSRLIQNNRTGTENYLHYMLQELLKVDQSNEYICYLRNELPESVKREYIGNNKRVKFKLLLKKFSWTQVSLSYSCMKDEIEVLICPWQTMPIIHRRSMHIVVIIHDIDIAVRKIGPSLYSSLFSDNIIAVSNYTKDNLITKFHINPHKIKVVYEGVDLKHFYKREVNEIQNTMSKYSIIDDYIFYIGSLNERKNLFNMLRAFAELINSNDLSSDNFSANKIKFVIGGSGEEEFINKLNNLCIKLGIQDRVDFLGRVSQQDLPALISGAKFLAYVSKSEGFGLPVLEALACQTPVVTSNTSSLKELFSQVSIQVDPTNVEEITRGYVAALTDKQLVSQMLEKGVSLTSDYSWEACAKSILDVLNSIVKFKDKDAD